MDLQGLLLVGRFAGVESVKYGASHPTKAGQDVPGFFRVSVENDLPSGEQITRSAAFSWRDRDTEELTPMARAIDSGDFAKGQQVAVRVAGKASGGYVNYNALRMVALAADLVAA